MTRGLLVGKDYEAGDNYRGVCGLYGIYDYIAPQTFRVSSTGAGASARRRNGGSRDGIALQGTALLGAGYTAVGTTHSTADNDYHYGVSPAGPARAAPDLRRTGGARSDRPRILRESASGRPRAAGHDNIARVDASFTVRVYQRHGVSIRYLLNRRDAFYPDVGDSSQTDARRQYRALPGVLGNGITSRTLRKARDVRDRSLEPETESRVRHRAVPAQVAIPAVMRRIEVGFGHPRIEHVEPLLALAAADDLADARREHVHRRNRSAVVVQRACRTP